MALTDRYGENNQSVIVTANTGAIETDVQSGRRKPQFVEKVIEISKGLAPVQALMMKLGQTKKFGHVDFKHLEYDMSPQIVEVDGQVAANGTSIVLTTGHGKRVRAGDILYNANTDDQIYVTSIATDTLTVTRSHGGTTEAIIADDAELQILAQTCADGGNVTSMYGIATEPNIKTNYLQINKELIELSGRYINSDNYGDDDVQRQMRNAIERLKVREEKSILFGGLSSSAPTTTGGFRHWISTNVTNAAGALTEADLNTWIKKMNRWNTDSGNNIVYFAGELVRDAIDSFGRARVEYRPNDKLIGLEVGRYQNSHGSLKLMKHGLLTDGADGNSKWSGLCFGLNLSLAARAEFKGRGLKLIKNVEVPGTDGVKHLWQDDFGVWIASERQHGLLKGVTG